MFDTNNKKIKINKSERTNKNRKFLSIEKSRRKAKVLGHNQFLFSGFSVFPLRRFDKKRERLLCSSLP
jgi:hypothetical protein